VTARQLSTIGLHLDDDADKAIPQQSPKSGVGLEVIRWVRAQLSNIVATGLEFALVTLLLKTHVYYLVAAAAGAVLGAVVDFSIKKWWAFAAHGGMLHKQMFRYAVVSAASAGLNCAIAYVLVDGLKMLELPGVIVAAVIVGVAWNYPMQRFHVFAGALGGIH
jgi:putative flippase GtrA